MRAWKATFCIVGAMIGAGFASGRELMQFFSRYGQFSWFLIMMTGGILLLLMERIMKRSRKGIQGILGKSRQSWIMHGIMFLLLAATGGGMTAAAGEIAALMIPVKHIQWFGMAVTLMICVFLSGRAIRSLHFLGILLFPLIVSAFLLCVRLEDVRPITCTPVLWKDRIKAIAGSMGYAGMNAVLSSGILCRIGNACESRRRCRCAVWAGGAMIGMLMMGNWVLLKHGELIDVTLPVVMLLNTYGKIGFFLSCILLYLAIVSTLIAVVQAIREMMRKRTEDHEKIFVYLVLLLAALAGFDQIVAIAYPSLGLICLIVLLFPQKKERLNQPPSHIHVSDACPQNNPFFP